MPTTNPVPSTDPSDLLFNAGKLDEVVNGTSTTYIDRLGITRRTLGGIDAEAETRMDTIDAAAIVQRDYIQDAADLVLAAAGYAPPVVYAAGISMTLQTQTVSYNGDAYAPKQSELPFITSGTFETAKFRLIQGVASADLPALVGQELQDYAALRAYTGLAKRIYITGLLVTAKPAGIAGHFQYDPTDTTSADNGGTIIVGADGRRWKRDYIGSINVGWFEPKGDDATDDTQAFVKANALAMSAPVVSTPQSWPTSYVTLEIPPGVYRVKGHRIFGSQVPTGSNGTFPPRMVHVLGGGATIIWEPITEDDELFYFDGTTDAWQIKSLSIFVVQPVIAPSGVGSIFRFYSNTALANQANAAKFHFEDITVRGGRYSVGGSTQRIKNIVKNTGNAMCDSMLFENCRFSHMNKVWTGENAQSVNITFSECAFWGAYSGSGVSTVYFDFISMGDNFNINNCTFSVFENEILLRTRSTSSGGYLTQSAHYNFNLSDNRIEIISGTAGGSWSLCDMDFGRLNMTNTNMAIGAGQYTTKTVVKAFELGNLNFSNVGFNKVDLLFPVSTIKSTGAGTLAPSGAIFKNCIMPSIGDTTYGFTDGVTTYTIKEALISNTVLWRNIVFQDCGYFGREALFNWRFVNPIAWGGRLNPRKVESITYSGSGIAFGKPLQLPPYQLVSKITLGMFIPLASTFDTFRVYFGDKSLNQYIDFSNDVPSVPKSSYVLFEGLATVFYDDLSMQSIQVVALSSGVENNGLVSQVTVEYQPIDPRVLGLTSVSDTVFKSAASIEIRSGTTAQRPTVGLKPSKFYFDTTLGKPIWWSGSAWKDAAGTTV